MQAERGSPEFYAQMTATRYAIQPWHPDLLRRFGPKGRLLEIGCGAGTDHAELAKMADSTVAIDLAMEGAQLTRDRLVLEARSSNVLVADGETLPFESDSFDAVYSFGVIHHTDHPERIVQEMHRVLKPGGRFLVGLYHRRSLFVLSVWIAYMRSRSFRNESWADYLGTIEAGAEESSERPVVRMYSRREAAALFSRFADVRTEVVHPGVPYAWAQHPRVASRFGWFVMIKGIKASREVDHPEPTSL